MTSEAERRKVRHSSAAAWMTKKREREEQEIAQQICDEIDCDLVPYAKNEVPPDDDDIPF
jgi:hypothetical protein